MTKAAHDDLVDGVCSRCGAPGTVGISCPECGEDLVVPLDVTLPAKPTEKAHPDTYSEEELYLGNLAEKEEDETL